MLLRICLVIAILAGAGVIAVGHFKVRPHIEGIIAERESEKSAKTKALTELATTKKNLDNTKKELASTKTTLAETQTQLASTKQQAEAETKRANGLKQDLAKRTEEYTESQQKLARWDAIGMDPVQVKGVIDDAKNLRLANQALDDEKKFFAKKYKDTKAQLEQLIGEGGDPPMPVGLRGKVLVVDPKWSFVLLDIGEKQGAVQNGVLMVSRNSKLVAKVRIMSIQGDKSIANIMPGWKLGEVMEGDYVLY